MTKLNTDKVVSLEDIGICVCCGTIIIVEDPLLFTWKCPNPKCNRVLGIEDFGHKEIKGVLRRIQYVSMGGKWTQRRPTDNFYLNGFKVTVQPLGCSNYSGR